jgi:hypothetical protein
MIVGLAVEKVVMSVWIPYWMAWRNPVPTVHVTVPSTIVGLSEGSVGHVGSAPAEVPAVVQRHVQPAKTAAVGMTTALVR